MFRSHRAAWVAVLSLVIVSAACSATTASGGGGGPRVAARQRPAADAVPTTTGAAPPVSPTTALPNLPTVPTVAPPTAAPSTAAGPTTAPISFTSVDDDYGMLTVEIPSAWAEVDTRPFVNDDGALRPGISASPDLDAFADQWDVPGMVYTAYRFQPDPNILFGEYDYSNQCTDAGTVPYNDQVFVGYLRTFDACSDVASRNYVIVANAPGNQVTIVLVVQTVTAVDEAAYQHVLETFNVNPNVSMPTETVPPDTTAPVPTAPLPTTPLPTTPQPTTPVPTAAVPTVPVPTTPVPTVPVPTSPALPTSPLLTTPVTVPVATVPVATVPGTSPSGVPEGYQEVTDVTGRLSIQVPSTWTDVDGASASEDGIEVAALSVAPSLTTFRETFDGPGLLIHETPFEPDPAAELARRGLAGTCTAGPVSPSPNPLFSGVHQSWLDCGGTTTDLHVLVANPTDGRQVTVVIVVQTLTAADDEALKIAFSSYRLNTTV